MSNFPITRLTMARLFANISICCLPLNERGCLDVAFAYVDLLNNRWTALKEETP